MLTKEDLKNWMEAMILRVNALEEENDRLKTVERAWKHVNSHLDELIIQWAKDRNLIEGATKQSQTVKLMEEMGELAEGIAKSKQDLVKDSLGDMYVVMTILAEMHGVTMKECIALAYDEIKDRKGKMVDGVFVKEV